LVHSASPGSVVDPDTGISNREGKVMRKIGWLIAAAALAFAGAACAQVDYSNRPPPQYGQPGYGQPQTVSCGSPRHRLARCRVPGYWRDARIVRQTSNASCVRGRSWGFDRGSIWVDKGCGGIFAAANGWRPGPDWNRNFVVSCGSPQYRYYFCEVDVGRRGQVRLQRQNSRSACIEGRTWGWNRAGIWVDKGCGAQFLVNRRW
jgi:hypothetical protein